MGFLSVQRNGFLILMPSLGLFFFCSFCLFLSNSNVLICVLSYSILLVCFLFSQEVCFLMRDRNGVDLDGGEDLGGVGEGETIIKT